MGHWAQFPSRLIPIKDELDRETRKALSRVECPITFCCVKEGLPDILFRQKHTDKYILREWENVRDSFFYLPVHGIAYDKEEFMDWTALNS